MASTSESGARESDEEYALRLQQQEDELARQTTSEVENDEAIARELAALDVQAATVPDAAAPSAERAATQGDEDLARSLQEEEKRASRPAPPVAHAYPAIDPRRTHPSVVQAYRLVSDLEAIVSEVGKWFESRIEEALRAGQVTAPPAAAPAQASAAGPAGEPAANGAAPPVTANGTAPPANGTASSIYGQSRAEYVVPVSARAAPCAARAPAGPGALTAGAPRGCCLRRACAQEVDDDQDLPAASAGTIGDLSAGPRVLKSRPEVELVAFGDEVVGSAADAVRMDGALEELILGRLCGLLQAMLSDGLMQPLLGGLFQGGARSAWSLFEAWANLIESRCESTMGEQERVKPSVCLIGLLKAIRRISQLYDEQLTQRPQLPPPYEFKFRALVCYGLKCAHPATRTRVSARHIRDAVAARLSARASHAHRCRPAPPRSVGELHEWFAMLALDGPADRIFDWYDSDAFLTMREAVLVAAEKLVPLASEQFRLPLQIECKAITRDGGLYCFAAQQEAHAWL